MADESKSSFSVFGLEICTLEGGGCTIWSEVVFGGGCGGKGAGALRLLGGNDEATKLVKDVVLENFKYQYK